MSRKNTASLLLLVALFLIGLFCVDAARANVTGDIANLVPPETVLLTEIGNFNELKAQFQKTNFYNLYKDPSMAEFVEDIDKKWREKVGELDNRIAEAITKADVLPQGKVAFAIAFDDSPEPQEIPGFLLIAQWGSNLEKIKEAITEEIKKAVNAGAHKKSSDYRSVTIDTIITEGKPQVSYCFIDDSLIGSNNDDLLKFVIARIKGAETPTLANDADYTETKKTVGPDHDIDVFVNIKQLIKTGMVLDNSGQIRMFLTSLGLENVRAFGLSIGLGRSVGNSFTAKGFVKIDGQKMGVCKILDLESDVIRVPDFIPASTSSVSIINMDINKTITELSNVLARFSPPMAAMLYMPLLPPGQDGSPGVQLKNDIIDHLGSKIVIATSIVTSPDGSMAPQFTYSIGLNNRSALEKSLSKVHSMIIAPNNPDARRELLGHTIYLFDLGMFMPGSAAGQQQKWAFTLTDTHVIIGMESAVEQALRTMGTSEPTLNTAKWFVAGKSSLPSTVAIASLQNDAVANEVFWQTLKKQKQEVENNDSKSSVGIGLNSQGNLMFMQKGLDFVDFSLLPDFEKVKKYFGLSVSHLTSRPDGFFMEIKSLDQSPKD
jgi:hypothetical protein